MIHITLSTVVELALTSIAISGYSLRTLSPGPLRDMASRTPPS